MPEYKVNIIQDILIMVIYYRWHIINCLVWERETTRKSLSVTYKVTCNNQHYSADLETLFNNKFELITY